MSPVDVEAVYHGPREDFVARRTELVQRLRASDADAAAAVGKLRKPTLSAWAIDQLAIEDPDAVTQLLAAGADVADAQRAVWGSDGSKEVLLDASARVREALEAAVRAATAVLERAGSAGGETVARRIRTTLQAAITGSSLDREALWRGTLDHDLEATGFGAPERDEQDVPELAAVLAPLRGARAHKAGGAPPGPSGPSPRDMVAVRAAERAAAEHDRLATRARALATTKRQHAAHLAAEARQAEIDADTAEEAARSAEEAARVRHAAVTSARSGQR